MCFAAAIMRPEDVKVVCPKEPTKKMDPKEVWHGSEIIEEGRKVRPWYGTLPEHGHDTISGNCDQLVGRVVPKDEVKDSPAALDEFWGGI